MISNTTEQLNEIRRIRAFLNEKYNGKFGSPFYTTATAWLDEQETSLTKTPPVMIATNSIQEINNKLNSLSNRNDTDNKIISEFNNLIQ